MNKIINCALLLVVLSNLVIFKTQGQNVFLPHNFLNYQMYVPVYDFENNGNVKHIGQKHMNEIVFDRVLGKKVEIYSFSNLNRNFPYDLNTVKTSNIDSIISNLSSYQPEYDIKQIKYYNFVEEWIFDADAFKFEKKVLAYQPVREFEFNGDDLSNTRKDIVFTILNPENVNFMSLTPIMQVKYEFLFDMPDYALQKDYFTKDIAVLSEIGIYPQSKQTPYWNTVVRNKIVDAVFSRILSNSIPVFDFNTGKYIPCNLIKKNVGITNDTVMVENFDNEGTFTESIIPQQFVPREIKSIYFIEDWFINPNNLNFAKNVVGLVPCRFFYKYELDSVFKEPVGRVYFDNESTERIELIYKQLVADNDFQSYLDGIELFTNMSNQSKNPNFKKLCKEKGQLLLNQVNKQNIEKEQYIAFYLLSLKINQPLNFATFLNANNDKLQYFAGTFQSMSDTASKPNNKILYLQNAKQCLEKLKSESADCHFQTDLENINEKLNTPTDINKILASNDKAYLNCYAEYYYFKYSKNKDNIDREKSKKLYTKLKDIDNNAFTMMKCLDLGILTKEQILQNSDTSILKDIIVDMYKMYFVNDTAQSEFNQLLYLSCQKILAMKYDPEYVKLLFEMDIKLSHKPDYQYMVKTDNKDEIFDYYVFVASINGALIPDIQVLFNKYIDKADKDQLWTMQYYQMVYYRWYSNYADVSKITFENAQTCLNMLLKVDFQPEYKIIQYEIETIKNINPDPMTFFDSKNIKHLQAYAQYFTGAYAEYYTPPMQWENEKQYEITNKETGLKLYDKLVAINQSDSIKREASTVCFDLEYTYLKFGDFAKALEIAPKIQKIDATNERGISGLVLAYLYNNQYNKAEQLVKQYKDKPSSQFETYSSMFQSDIKEINSIQPNDGCTKILTLLKNQK